MHKKSSFLMMGAVIFLGACAGGAAQGIPSGLSREDVAGKLAQQGRLIRKDIGAGAFTLASWQRIGAPGKPIRVYIEGDGLAWLNRNTPSPDPTPKNPVALALAAADPAVNVIYIARPCQYGAGNTNSTPCARDYWTSKRFSTEVIAAYDTALTRLAAETGGGGYHLVGYSGGANIAGLLAARRSDIVDLRTVAGNLDNTFFTKHHNVSEMPQSLNMADEASALAHLPQLHFIGGADKFVPESIFQSYLAKAGKNTNCIHYKVMEHYSHMEPWVSAWPALLAEPVACGP